MTTLGTTFNQLVECFECTAGLFQDEEAKLICKNCAAGKFSEQGSSACDECVPGFYRPTLTSPACTASSPGYYVDTIGAITQLPCPVGSRSPGTAQTNSLCEMCDPGYFQDVTGQASCKSCAKGYLRHRSATTENARPAATASRRQQLGSLAARRAPLGPTVQAKVTMSVKPAQVDNILALVQACAQNVQLVVKLLQATRTRVKRTLVLTVKSVLTKTRLVVYYAKFALKVVM